MIELPFKASIDAAVSRFDGLLKMGSCSTSFSDYEIALFSAFELDSAGVTEENAAVYGLPSTISLEGNRVVRLKVSSIRGKRNCFLFRSSEPLSAQPRWASAIQEKYRRDIRIIANDVLVLTKAPVDDFFKGDVVVNDRLLPLSIECDFDHYDRISSESEASLKVLANNGKDLEQRAVAKCCSYLETLRRDWHFSAKDLKQFCSTISISRVSVDGNWIKFWFDAIPLLDGHSVAIELDVSKRPHKVKGVRSE